MIKYLILTFILICTFSTGIYSQIQSEQYLEGAAVTAIDQEGSYIWVSTYGYGVFRYSLKDGKWENFSTKNNKLKTDLFYTIAASPKYIWAGSSEGLYVYNKRRNIWTKKTFALGGEMGNWIRSLCYDRSQNVLWIGRFKNLTRLDVKRNKYKDFNLTKNNDAKTNTITSIKLDGDSLVWFGTESGVHIFEKKKNPNDIKSWRFINNKKNAFNGDGYAVSIHDLLFERHYVWFATDEFVTKQQPEFNIGGIYKYNRILQWERISSLNGLPANGVYCLERTGNQIWAGIYSFDRNDKKEIGKGLVIINRLTNQVTPVDLNQLGQNISTVSCLYFDGWDMWIGTDEGLWRVRIANPLAVWVNKKESKSKLK